MVTIRVKSDITNLENSNNFLEQVEMVTEVKRRYVIFHSISRRASERETPLEDVRKYI